MQTPRHGGAVVSTGYHASRMSSYPQAGSGLSGLGEFVARAGTFLCGNINSAKKLLFNICLLKFLDSDWLCVSSPLQVMLEQYHMIRFLFSGRDRWVSNKKK